MFFCLSRLLVDDLDAADRERNLLKSELHGLARALSPLKKEVTEVIKKQENLKNEVDAKPYHDISGEVARIKDELSSFLAEKSQLEMEQCELEVKLKVVGLEKEDLRIKLRTLIQVRKLLNIIFLLGVRMSSIYFWKLSIHTYSRIHRTHIQYGKCLLIADAAFF